MADKYKIKLNRAGVRKLMRSQEMMNGLTNLAYSAANRCGDGYSVQYYTAQTRAVATVAAVTKQAKKDNLKNNTILKALK